MNAKDFSKFYHSILTTPRDNWNTLVYQWLKNIVPPNIETTTTSVPIETNSADCAANNTMPSEWVVKQDVARVIRSSTPYVGICKESIKYVLRELLYKKINPTIKSVIEYSAVECSIDVNLFSSESRFDVSYKFLNPMETVFLMELTMNPEKYFENVTRDDSTLVCRNLKKEFVPKLDKANCLKCFLYNILVYAYVGCKFMDMKHVLIEALTELKDEEKHFQPPNQNQGFFDKILGFLSKTNLSKDMDEYIRDMQDTLL